MVKLDRKGGPDSITFTPLDDLQFMPRTDFVRVVTDEILKVSQDSDCSVLYAWNRQLRENKINSQYSFVENVQKVFLPRYYGGLDATGKWKELHALTSFEIMLPDPCLGLYFDRSDKELRTTRYIILNDGISVDEVKTTPISGTNYVFYSDEWAETNQELLMYLNFVSSGEGMAKVIGDRCQNVPGDLCDLLTWNARNDLAIAYPDHYYFNIN